MTNQIAVEKPRTVDMIPDSELLLRAVLSARRTGRKGYKHARWTAVAERFGLGSTFSMQLCRRYGLDPEEMVRI